SPGEGRVLMRTIRTVTRAPVRYLVLTHHHPDHTFGAIVFKRAGARVIAHPDRRTLANIDGDDRLASDWTGVMGLEQMRGFAYADTPDIPVRRDTMIVDGSSAAMLGALSRIDALDPRVAVPGHGRLATHPATLVATTRCYVLALRDTMRRAVADGVRMGLALDQLPPADRDRPVSLHSRLRRNAVRVYSEMEQSLLGSSPSKAALAAEARQLSACPQSGSNVR